MNNGKIPLTLWRYPWWFYWDVSIFSESQLEHIWIEQSQRFDEPAESKSNSVSMDHLQNVLPWYIFNSILNALISSQGDGRLCLEVLLSETLFYSGGGVSFEFKLQQHYLHHKLLLLWWDFFETIYSTSWLTITAQSRCVIMISTIKVALPPVW